MKNRLALYPILMAICSVAPAMTVNVDLQNTTGLAVNDFHIVLGSADGNPLSIGQSYECVHCSDGAPYIVSWASSALKSPIYTPIASGPSLEVSWDMSAGTSIFQNQWTHIGLDTSANAYIAEAFWTRDGSKVGNVLLPIPMISGGNSSLYTLVYITMNSGARLFAEGQGTDVLFSSMEGIGKWQKVTGQKPSGLQNLNYGGYVAAVPLPGSILLFVSAFGMLSSFWSFNHARRAKGRKGNFLARG